MRKTVALLDTEYERVLFFIPKKIWSRERDESQGEPIFLSSKPNFIFP